MLAMPRAGTHQRAIPQMSDLQHKDGAAQGRTASAAEDQVLRTLAEFETGLASLKNLYAQRQALEDEIRRKQDALQEREARAAASEREVAQLKEWASQRTQELEDLRGALEAREAELARRQEELSASLGACELSKAELARTIASEREELDTERAALEARRAAFEAERAGLDEALAAIASDRAALEALAGEIETRQADASAAASDAQALASELKKRQEEVEAREHAAQERAHLLAEGEAVLAQRLGELSGREQRLAADLSRLEALRRQIASETSDLATAHEQLALRQRELASSQQQLAQDQSSLAEAQANLASLERALTARQKEMDQRTGEMAHEAKAVQMAAQKAAHVQQDQADSIRAELDAALFRQRAMLDVIEEYEALWTVERGYAADIKARALHETTGVGAVIEGLKERLKAQIETSRNAQKEWDAQRSSLKKEIDELRTRQPGGALGSSRAARSLELRRKRLRLYRDTVRRQAGKVRKAGEAIKKRIEQVEQVLAQRAELASARQRVIEAEQRVSRQTAASRAAVTLLCVAGVLSLLLGLSWAIAREVAPAAFEATSVVKAEGRDRTLSQPELREWQRFHEALLRDPRFHEAAADRFRRQGIVSLASASSVADLVKERITTESMAEGELKLRLSGKGAEATSRLLESFTAGFMAYANSGHAQRIDGGITVAAQHATAGSEPIDNVRVIYAGGIFGAGFAASAFLGAFIWRRLTREKSAFEQDTSISGVLDESRWRTPEA